MTRKERVYNELKSLCVQITLDSLKKGFSGFDATEIGEKIGISRSNTSKELNLLVDEKRAIKICGRPVLFLDKSKIEELIDTTLKENQFVVSSIEELTALKKDIQREQSLENNTFGKIIGSSGSLQIAIKQAKAAVLYPPRGLHTLLVGPTGVGKTTFAELMYNYAVQSGQLKSEAKFIIFNCSEYAENPQLILSQLFGHVKGAFTGADKDKSGFIEKTNGGILLLDEIHRLTPEGQEMLFLLMDKNIYRRLGETENAREANVLLIGATTEDVNSSLLKTFLRRIPMVIKLPSISERPLSEKLQLITQFFKDEIKSVQVPIKVYKDAIKAFLLYDCYGNIGQLKGDIQLTCARGFLEYKTFGKKLIEIDTTLIPEHVYRGLLNTKNRRDEVVDFLDIQEKKYFQFSKSDGEIFTSVDDYNISGDLYKEIGDKYSSYLERGYSQEKIKEKINKHIEKYLKKLLQKINLEKETLENEELFKIISPRIYYAVETVLSVAEKKLKKTFSKKVNIALAMHISALIERIAENKIISNEEINKIALNHPNEFNTAKIVKEIIEEELVTNMPKEEIGFIAMFLFAVDSDNSHENKKIGVIVLAHGKYTASSIADVANSLLDTNHCKAIDMPLDEKVENILDKTIELVKQVDQGKGVLLLVDMGSLVAFAEIITKKTNINVRSIEMVSTPIVLEAVRKCVLREMTLDELIEDIQKLTPYIGRLVTNNVKAKAAMDRPGVIITTCITGEGTAVKLAQLLKSSLPIIDEYNIVLRPMNMDDLKENNLEVKEDIIVIVGSVNSHIPNIPFIAIDELITGNGLKKIDKMIRNLDIVINDNKSFQEEPNLIIKMLSETLIFLNPVKAYHTISESLKEIIKALGVQGSQRLQLGYIFHCCSMVERALRKEPLPYEDVEALIKNKVELYQIIKSALVIIEETFGVDIPNTEVGYLIDLIDTH